MEDNPLPAVMGRVCYHPCETACNRGAARRGGRHQLRRALPRRRGDPARLDASRSPAPPTGKRVLVVGAGPVRAVGRLPPRARSATRSTIHDAGPLRRRHDALRHPALPAAARGPRRRDRSGSSTSASTLELQPHGRRPRRPRCATAASTPPSSPSARTSASAPTSRPAAPRKILDAVSRAAQHGGRGAAAARPPRRRLRRRQHRDGRRAHRQAPRRRGGRRRLPAHARPDARARLRGRGGARGGRAR